MTTIRVRDVHQALEVAVRLKAEGKCDWFRGQLQNWHVCPTALRLTATQRDEARHKLGRFEHWIRATRGLESLPQSPDMFFAVAQHYGLPTNYLDFTTSPEVAAFFSADNPGNRSLDGDSCIVCLNTRDLIRFWKSMPPKYPAPELIEVDVSNLWRLQAQEGRFLFCQYRNIEDIYDFDRIVFPYTGPLRSRHRERIYPQEKSSLEILLDQFFMTERMLASSILINSLPGFQSMSRLRVEDTKGVDGEVLARDLTVHASWTDHALQPWLDEGREEYHDIVRDQTCQVRLDAHNLNDRGSLRAHMLSLLSSQGPRRQTSVGWEVVPERPSILSASDELSMALNQLWDGVRRLPYSDEQISYSMAETITLWRYSDGGRGYSKDRGRLAAEKCFGPSIVELEFGAADGSYSRAYVTTEMLSTALRSDINGFLAPSWKDVSMSHPPSVVQVIRIPRLLFDLPRLADVLVRQVVPFQVVFRRHQAVFFSPARLDRMGFP